jgi:hypothetical protein
MNVILPDGTTLKNVPEGTTKQQISARLRGEHGTDQWFKDTKNAEGRPNQSDFVAKLNQGAKDINAGFMDILGIPVDAMENVLNLGKAGVGAAGKATGLLSAGQMPEPSHGAVGGSEWLKSLVPSAVPGKDEGGGMLDSILESLPAGLLGKSPDIPALLKNLASTILPSLGADITGRVGGGSAEQQAAALATGHGQSALARAPGAIRGKAVDPAQVRQSLQYQKQAGIQQPGAGATTQNPILKTTEAVLGHLPGSDIHQEHLAKQRASDLQNAVGRTARRLTPESVSAEKAGKAITEGGEESVRSMQGTQGSLYAKAAAAIPKTTPVTVSTFEADLNEFTKTVSGAEKTTGSLVNPKIAQLARDIQEDLNKATTAQPSAILGPGGKPITKPAVSTTRSIPFEAADLIRQRIGQALDNALISDYPKSQLKKLYGSITTDIENSLPKGSAGRKAWERARRYTKAMHERVETYIQPLQDKQTPEKALKAALSGTREGASAFRAIMKTLPAKQADMVRANVIEGMGKATAGAQTAAGDVFSIDTFLTNWNKMSPEARRVLFADPKVQSDMEAIARVSESYKKSHGRLYNPSGTTRGVTYGAIGLDIARSILTGNLAEASVALGIPAATYGLSKALASPKFIHWLADTAKAPPDRQLRRLTQLQVIADRSKGPEKEAIQDIYDRLEAIMPGIKDVGRQSQ